MDFAKGSVSRRFAVVIFLDVESQRKQKFRLESAAREVLKVSNPPSKEGVLLMNQMKKLVYR